MKKKKRLLPIVMASLMAMSINVGPLKAADAPLITNPSFEHEIDKNEVQLYKAVRTDEKAFDGKYSIKVGNPKPENPSEVPIWRYNYGKGSVNVIFHNVEPNTTYKITTHYWNESGVKMSTGVLDIEGKHTTSPWQLASNIQTNQKVSTEWQTNEHTITTGPRTNEIYGFAYMEWTGNDLGSGVFYIDDFKIEKVENKTVEEKASINYDADFSEFPETVPAVQNFEKNGIVHIENLVKRYGSLVALDHLNLDIQEGEIFGLLGPNGSGKTTAINCMLALLKYDKGSIQIFGQEMRPDNYEVKNQIGIILQNVAVFDELTVYENICFPLYLQKRQGKREEIYDLLKMLELEEKIDVYPEQLSGGQQQRVAIARALASEAPIILADEPTGNLDENTAQEITQILKVSAHEQGKCVVVVTHSNELARQADVVFGLRNGKIQPLENYL